MNILIAGMPRSASTALFNVVRYLLEENGKDYYSGFYGYNNKFKDINVLKIHGYDKTCHEWADYIILPQRDIRDVVTSYNKYRSHDSTEPFVLAGRYIEWNDNWEKYADNIIEYSDFVNKPNEVIEKIGKDIGVSIIEPLKILDKINGIYQKVKRGELKQGVDHFFYSNHVTNGGIGYYKEQLSKQNIKRINTEYKDWIIKHNYEI